MPARDGVEHQGDRKLAAQAEMDRETIGAVSVRGGPVAAKLLAQNLSDVGTGEHRQPARPRGLGGEGTIGRCHELDVAIQRSEALTTTVEAALTDPGNVGGDDRM